MKTSPREKLSNKVEEIFTNFTQGGVYECNLATGAGKSYCIGKLVCTKYAEEFSKIIIVCVQNKLLQQMQDDISRFIDSDTPIQQDDILVVRTNEENFRRAIENNPQGKTNMEEFLAEMKKVIRYYCPGKKMEYCINRVEYAIEKAKNSYYNMKETYNDTEVKKMRENVFVEAERELRTEIKITIEKFKEAYGMKYHKRNLKITEAIPSITKVYPQCLYHKKRVIIISAHKVIYGLDPIVDIHKTVTLVELVKPAQGKTMLILDESDQVAQNWRRIFVEKAINDNKLTSYPNMRKIWNAIKNCDQIDEDDDEPPVKRITQTIYPQIEKLWNTLTNHCIPFNSIYPEDIKNIMEYCSGSFFCGPLIHLELTLKYDKNSPIRSFIYHLKDKKYFNISHCSPDSIKEKFGEGCMDMLLEIKRFVYGIILVFSKLKNEIAYLAMERYNSKMKRREEYIQKYKDDKVELNDVDFFQDISLYQEFFTIYTRLGFDRESAITFSSEGTEYIANNGRQIFKDMQSDRFTDFSIYMKGCEIVTEDVSRLDNKKSIDLKFICIRFTPEKLLRTIVESNQNLTVILSSATANYNSVVNNWNIDYLKNMMGNKYHVLPQKDLSEFEKLLKATYPERHKINVQSIQDALDIPKGIFPTVEEIKAKMREKVMDEFPYKKEPEGLYVMCDEIFNKCIKDINSSERIQNGIFHINRWFQFISVYARFYQEKNIKTLMFFQNSSGTDDENFYKKIAHFVEEFVDTKGEKASFGSTGTSTYVCLTHELEELKTNYLRKVEEGIYDKFILITAYASFKAGTNLQYKVPKGIHLLKGDDWSKGQDIKKDWDAIYLQEPTNYAYNENETKTTKEEAEKDIQKGIHVLTIMGLYEKGLLNFNQVKDSLQKLYVSKRDVKSLKNIGTVRMDYQSWGQNIINQSIGRICRTKNKGPETFIFFDNKIKEIYGELQEGSFTPEYRAFVDYIMKMVKRNNADEMQMRRNSNIQEQAKAQLKYVLKSALATFWMEIDFENNEILSCHKDYEEKVKNFNIDEDNDDDDISIDPMVTEIEIIRREQRRNESMKDIFIHYPTIESLDNLQEETENNKILLKCYAPWKMSENQEITYIEKNGEQKCLQVVSPVTTRLSIMARCPAIAEYFRRKNIPLEWEDKGLILHPAILREHYCGEIGEQAFRAIVYHLIQDDTLLEKPKDKDYELVDYVIYNKARTGYMVGFDVKNYKSDNFGENSGKEMKPEEKRAYKEKRLGCRFYMVNILEMDDKSNHQFVITGLVHENGVLKEDTCKNLKELLLAIKDRREHQELEQPTVSPEDIPSIQD